MKKNKKPISETHKELIETEWNYEKNIQLGLDPTKLTYGSHKKAWWKCKKGHKWEAFINNRGYGAKCPYCTNQKVCEDNCILDKNPKLMKEWNYTKNNSLGIYPTKLTHGSEKKVWWICKNKHQWESPLRYRSFGYGCPKCAIENNKGKNHFNYNPNLTDKEREENKKRNRSHNHRIWTKKIYKRDNYTCQICKHRGGNLNAHHIIGYNMCKELRFSIDNGITLCSKCHNNFHKIYGKGNNTKNQFEEFKIKIDNGTQPLSIHNNNNNINLF